MNRARNDRVCLGVVAAVTIAAFGGCSGVASPQEAAEGSAITVDPTSGDIGLDTQRVPDIGAGGACAGGDVVRRTAAGWECAPASAAGGDVTSVVAGPGLTGGGATGDVTLGVDFAGDGTAATVARSDHTHDYSELTGVPPGGGLVYTNPATGESVTLVGSYCGATTPVTGAVGGYAGAKALCEAACGGSPTAHACTSLEMVVQVATGGASPPTNSRIATGVFAQGVSGGVFYTADCNAFTSSGTEHFSVLWNTPGFGHADCSSALPIACCD